MAVGVRQSIGCRVAAVVLFAMTAALASSAPAATASSSVEFSSGADGRSERAERGTGSDCQDPAAVCIPDGNYTITATNTNPAACRFSVTIRWGDGSTDKFTMGPSRDVAHRYKKPGIYTISVTGKVAAVLQPGATCTGGSGTIRVEFPAARAADRALMKTVDLAGDFRSDHKRLRKANHRKLNKKLKKAVKEVVRDGRVAKKLERDYRELGLPKKGDILVPCPTSRRWPAKRDCTGEVVEKAQDLWGFLKSLQELADYPKYQRKKADEYYKTPDGRQELDLRAAQNFGRDKTYGELNNDQKQIIASQAQVSDGAIHKVLRDARKAGKAGSQLAF